MCVFSKCACTACAHETSAQGILFCETSLVCVRAYVCIQQMCLHCVCSWNFYARHFLCDTSVCVCVCAYVCISKVVCATCAHEIATQGTVWWNITSLCARMRIQQIFLHCVCPWDYHATYWCIPDVYVRDWTLSRYNMCGCVSVMDVCVRAIDLSADTLCLLWMCVCVSWVKKYAYNICACMCVQCVTYETECLLADSCFCAQARRIVTYICACMCVCAWTVCMTYETECLLTDTCFFVYTG